jgi:Tol biopolymer transport system component/DNA-binding winged helix-turn-helix (wHTH) protein
MSKSFEMTGVVEGIPEEFLRTAMTTQINELYEFGGCRLDVLRRVLTRDGHPVSLAPKTFELLLLLVQSQGRALSKQELMTALWPDVFVEEANLSFQISALRRTLGEGTSKWLETIPKHGYRFAAPVRAVPAQPDDVAQSSTPGVAEVAPVAHPAYRRRWITGILALLAIAIALSVALLQRSTAMLKSAAVPVAVPLTTDPGYENMPSLSPDGSQVAFAWSKESKPDYDIYVKLVGPGEPIPLTNDPSSHDLNPAWSPDGRLIAFERCTTRSTSDLYVIPALGGAAEQRIATGPAGCGSFKSIAWTPDGEWLAWANRPGIGLFDIHSREKRQLTVDGRIPAFSEDGRRMAYIRRVGPGVAVHVLPLTAELTAAGPPVRVTPPVPIIRTIAWTPRGDALVYSVAGWVGVSSRLYRVALAADRLDPAGSPQVLPFGENGDTFSISRKTGSLVYSAFLRDTALMRLDLKELNRAPVPVAESTYDEYTPDYSPDGRRIAFSSTRTGAEEIWIADADGSKPVRMTTMNGPVCSGPRWSPPDGRKILFHSTGSATMRALYALDVTTGARQQLTDGPHRDSQASWSRDGQTIYFLSQSPQSSDIWKMPAGGGTRVQVTRHGGLFGIESFDRRVLYYAKPVGSDFAIWRVPVDGGEEVAVTGVGLTDSLNFAVAREGLYFLSGSSILEGLLGDTPLGKDTIDFFDFKTGRRRTILELGKRSCFGIVVSPDERYLLYSVVNSVSRNLMFVDKIE